MTAGDLHARILGWVARLPLCGARELAVLADVEERAAAAALVDLERAGWLESVRAAVGGEDRRRLVLVREDALPSLATALGVRKATLGRQVAVRRSDVLERLAGLEITAGVNGLLVRLALASRESGAELVDARALPLGVPAAGRWWLPNVDAYACLRAGDRWAACFVAWDRAGAPTMARRRRVASWLRADAVHTHWDAGVPPIVVVCPTERERREWAEAAANAQRRTRARIDLMVVARHERQQACPAGARSRECPGRGPVRLLDRLRWGPQPPEAPVVVRAPLPDLRPVVRTSATRGGQPRAAAALRARLAAVAIAATPADWAILRWLGRHPMLSVRELAVLLRSWERGVERACTWLAERGLIDATASGAAPTSEEPCFVLTELGVRALAAADGVPTTTYARYAGVSFVPAGGNAGDVVRHHAHALGVNRFFVRLAGDARTHDWWLREWRNETESTRRFRDATGRWRWIRPDGGGRFTNSERTHPFLLEYDRGTLDAGDFRPKLGAYAAYFAEQAWRGDFESRPMLLFVCADERAEGRVVRALEWLEQAGPVPALVTTTWRYERDPQQSAGLWGPIWRGGDDDAPRRRWPAINAESKF